MKVGPPLSCSGPSKANCSVAMVPVKSLATQPKLPLVLPMRLCPDC